MATPAQPAGIAVFGSSEPTPADPLYRLARELGRAVARAGLPVVTGGYGGVMEAASRGAREAGGRAIGVTCAIFDGRRPNPYLSETVSTPDLFLRTRELVARAHGFVILPGKAGTLAELSFLWALDRAGCLGGRGVVVLGDVWPGLVGELGRRAILEPSQLEGTRVAGTPDEALRLLGVPAPRQPDAGGKEGPP